MSMSNNIIPPFLTLPVELVYRILDKLNQLTILLSVRNVCARLNVITDTYYRYQVNLSFIFKSEFHHLPNDAQFYSLLSWAIDQIEYHLMLLGLSIFFALETITKRNIIMLSYIQLSTGDFFVSDDSLIAMLRSESHVAILNLQRIYIYTESFLNTE
jgi:hypothetical protein